MSKIKYVNELIKVLKKTPSQDLTKVIKGNKEVDLEILEAQIKDLDDTLIKVENFDKNTEKMPLVHFSNFKKMDNNEEIKETFIQILIDKNIILKNVLKETGLNPNVSIDSVSNIGVSFANYDNPDLDPRATDGSTKGTPGAVSETLRMNRKDNQNMKEYFIKENEGEYKEFIQWYAETYKGGINQEDLEKVIDGNLNSIMNDGDSSYSMIEEFEIQNQKSKTKYK